MAVISKRRSDRIYLRLPIQVSGTDCKHFAFADHTETLVLSAHGALILLKRDLVPEQEVSIYFAPARREVAARVVGQIGEDAEGRYYGVEFLDPEANLWEIEFPPLAKSEDAAARVLLECENCHRREVAYLNEFEAEVYEANRCIWRTCQRCGETRPWWEVGAEDLAEYEEAALDVAEAAEAPAPARPRTRNERRHARLSLHMTACIRHPQLGDEVISTQNVSRGGLCFTSRKLYGVGSVIQVAVPYSEGGANIFAPARIVRSQDSEGAYIYGISYVPVHKGWPEDLNVPTLSMD